MRRRIVLLTVGMTLLVVLAFSIPLALLIRQSIESHHLDEARLQAESVAFFISSQDPDGDQVAQYLNAYADRYTGQTWVVLPDGRVVGSPPDDVNPRPTPEDDEREEYEEHERDDDDHGVSAAAVIDLDDGTATRVRATTPLGVADAYVYLTDDELREGEALALLALAGVSVLLLAISFGAAEAVSRRLALPLEKTAAAAEGLAAGDLEARAPENGPPEVAEVGVALNRLADRVDEVIAVEREAVADLSHRLRTPLTALRLDVDALEDRDTSQRLGEQVSMLERTLTAIIRAARRPQREGRSPQADASRVVGARALFWSPLAEDQGRAVSVSVPDTPLPVRAADEDLAAAVDALIENVVAHTPDGGALWIAAHGEPDGTVVITIADEGPGIPEALWSRGRSDRGSSGLGLDIARRCAEAAGGSLRVGPRQPRGAVVEMRLGPPVARAAS